MKSGISASGSGRLDNSNHARHWRLPEKLSKIFNYFLLECIRGLTRSRRRIEAQRKRPQCMEAKGKKDHWFSGDISQCWS